MLEIDRTLLCVLCPFCGSSLIEDEVPLFRSPTYFMIGENFYNKVKFLIPDINEILPNDY